MAIMPDEIPENCTLNDFLGGAVKLIQPVDGYRVSMDTVMLAAAVSAKAGEHILEAGTGTAGAALCLAHRLENVRITGIEMQRNLIDLAKANIFLNKKQDRVQVVEGDITASVKLFKEGSFDHVMVNPPYLTPGTAIRPPKETKGLAHMNTSATLKDWVMFCIAMARHKGTITIIHRADQLDVLIKLLQGRVGDLCLLPLWPRTGESAKRVIIQGRKGTHGVMRLLPGIALHGENTRYTKEVEAILRDGKAIKLGTILGFDPTVK